MNAVLLKRIGNNSLVGVTFAKAGTHKNAQTLNLVEREGYLYDLIRDVYHIRAKRECGKFSKKP